MDNGAFEMNPFESRNQSLSGGRGSCRLIKNNRYGIPIVGLSAYSGSGKTTFLEKLIPELKARGYRVAVLKHDTHGIEIDHPGKDSYRLTEAGADMVIVNSAAKTFRIENRPVSVMALLDDICDVELILLEGYKHVYKNGSALQMLGSEAFYDQYIAPTITEFISRRFEEICRSYFSIEARSGRMPGLRNIGTYYYDDPKNHKNGEFDGALEYQDGFDLYEVKYFIGSMEMDEIHREAGQIRDIQGIQVRKIGFISVNGFSKKEDGYTYLTGEDLFRTAETAKL